MSRFDDELRGAAAPIAREPLPDGVLDEALDAAPARPRWPVAAGAVTAALVLAIAAGIGFGELVPSPPPSASPSAAQSGSSAPSPSHSPTAPPSTPSPSDPPPTPGPTVTHPPAEPVSNTIEDQGIRLTLALDRDRISFGERTWADVTVENFGADTVYWGHSSTCVYAASVAAFPDVAEEMSYGRDDWPGDSGTLKSVTVFESAFIGHGFTPEDRVDLEGNFGCTTDLQISEIGPGAVVTYRAAWDGDGMYELPATPGTYHVDATFHYMSRGAPPPMEAGTAGHAVTVSVPMTVHGPEIDYLGPGEAVDRLLADAAFQEHLADAPRERWLESDLAFEDGNWVLILYLRGPDRAIAATEAIVATVDAVSGDVIDVEVVQDPDWPGDG